jgi:hypothetical protein
MIKRYNNKKRLINTGQVIIIHLIIKGLINMTIKIKNTIKNGFNKIKEVLKELNYVLITYYDFKVLFNGKLKDKRILL